MNTAINRESKGQPTGGQFATHTRNEASISLNAEQPMPEIGQKVTHNGVEKTVKHIEQRTAMVEHANGDLELLSDKDLGLDKPAAEEEPEPYAPARLFPPIAPLKLPEVNRRLRGHQFFPNMKKWPELYATERVPVAEKTIVAHYFGPAGDWYIAEADPETGMAFGYSRLTSQPGTAEWGYINLPELEELRVGIWVGAERELAHNPKSLAKDIIAELKE
tara:strand:- start:5381 stop:6037 length:657 start_codon:yes stop_codon:yes gene_type:complete